MRMLILGAGVIGATYGWQLANAGHDVSVFVHPEKKEDYKRDGIVIRCRDERPGGKDSGEVVFRPPFVSELKVGDSYGLIVVCVRSNQLDPVLPLLADQAGPADILFFQNNWRGDAVIGQQLQASQVFYGFSRLVGGWRDGHVVNAVIFDGPGQATMLGEKNGQTSQRLAAVRDMFQTARLKPEISRDILGWLMAHYVEYLGPVGAILQAGSAAKFAASSELVKEAILATREGLDVCKARGLDVGKSAPANLRMFYMPTAVTVPLAKMQYGQPNIQEFFAESISHGMGEIAAQYFDVINEGRRLGVAMPHLEAFEPYIRGTARRTLVLGQKSPFANDHTSAG